MNIASNRPRSIVRAMCCQYSGREKCQPILSLVLRHMPVAWLLTPCWMKPSRCAFLGSFIGGLLVCLCARPGWGSWRSGAHGVGLRLGVRTADALHERHGVAPRVGQLAYELVDAAGPGGRHEPGQPGKAA